MNAEDIGQKVLTVLGHVSELAAQHPDVALALLQIVQTIVRSSAQEAGSK